MADESSKLKDFLAEKKLDARRVMNASTKLERLTPADRKIRLAKRQAKKSDGDKKDAPKDKPRSGRPVTQRAIDAALAGKSISGPQKTRILRAVNHLLEQKKQAAVELSALFTFPPKADKAESAEAG
jgi:hypothetical protein